jgi:hypothetical protein
VAVTPGIYLIGENDELVEMTEQLYESEDLLQRLLETYPNLLAGDQFPGEEPRRWLLVSREAGVASEEGGAARWSIDHVFLDQSGIPTLVEVKRSTDTRIRREVVGQMLDYAANAIVHWPVQELRLRFEETCERREVAADQILADVLSADDEPEAFWAMVQTNLQAGRIRMVFVSDLIPPELRRVVEFLNQQMGTAEVLAVEIKQYLGEGRRTLVPRVIGQTAAAQQAKRPSRPRQWDDESFVARFEEKWGAAAATVLTEIVSRAAEHGYRPEYGTAAKDPTCYLTLERGDVRFRAISFNTWGKGVYVPTSGLKTRPPFDAAETRTEYWRQLGAIPGVSPDALDRTATFPFELLEQPGALDGLFSALDWFSAQVHGS